MREDLQAVTTRSAARAAGLKRYTSDSQCVYGHGRVKYTNNSKCVVCNAELRKVWAAANPDKIAAIDARLKSIPENKAKHAARERNRYRAANPDWKPVVVRTPEEKSEMARVARRRYYERRTDYLLALNRDQRAKRANAEGKHSGADVSRIVVLQNGKCAYCRCKISGKFHVDHIMPLAKGGTNWPNNLQILCQPCNNKKSAKHPLVFARQIGRLL